MSPARRRSVTPEGPLRIVLPRLIRSEFRHPTKGKAELHYPDGRVEAVHRFGNYAYRIIDHNTTTPTCVLTYFEILSSESLHGNATLILQLVESEEVHLDFPVDIHIIDERHIAADAILAEIESRIS